MRNVSHLAYGDSRVLVDVATAVDKSHLSPVKHLENRHNILGNLRISGLRAGERRVKFLVAHLGL